MEEKMVVVRMEETCLRALTSRFPYILGRGKKELSSPVSSPLPSLHSQVVPHKIATILPTGTRSRAADLGHPIGRSR